MDMKTYKEAINEGNGDHLNDLKLDLIDWWKKNKNSSALKPKKKVLEKKFNELLNNMDDVIDIVFE